MTKNDFINKGTILKTTFYLKYDNSKARILRLLSCWKIATCFSLVKRIFVVKRLQKDLYNYLKKAVLVRKHMRGIKTLDPKLQ